ncbi:ImmA/IrrE family metallo-endopeptidase [Embleya sp. NPDC059259]|uniref:ImmA/IrrE family metallo-endopeptidase n=1 Tax=unclassified Embleya TaxID=2699296 RepID=UPI0036B1057D
MVETRTCIRSNGNGNGNGCDDRLSPSSWVQRSTARMDLKRLRDASRKRLERLDIVIPDPFDAQLLCENISRARGRALRLMPLPEGMPAGMPCGMWAATEKADWVWYDASTSPAHQRHIVAHELAHVLCDHNGGMDALMAGRLSPDLDPATIRRMIGRTSYTDFQELEAETLATLLTLPAAPSSPELSGRVLSRLHASLTEPAQRLRRRS